MWNSNATTNPNPLVASQLLPSQQQPQQPPPPKHDIFVGNLAFTTTEEQIHQAFSEIGQVIKVRMVSDIETGKPRGFAFVEFEDPQAALAAIRNMNDYELNGRKLRVNFSNSSHLETLAGQLGMDLSKKDSKSGGVGGGSSSTSGGAAVGGVGEGTSGMMGNVGSMGATAASAAGMGVGLASSSSSSSELGTQAIANALKNMSKGEMYDIVSQLKVIADQNPDEARKIISSHPQLPEALLYLMSQLDMIKTPLSNALLMNPVSAMSMSTSSSSNVGAPPPPPVGMPGGMMAPPPPMVHPLGGGVPPPPPVAAAVEAPRMDPRMAVGAGAGAAVTTTAAAVRQDPRAAAAAAAAAVGMRQDPRLAMGGGGGGGGGGMSAAVYGQPPPVPQPQMQPQPQPQPPMPMMGVAGLDPSLVQQVMGLTQAQIQQLPVEKQSSILALRQQIANAMSAMGGGGGAM